MTATDTLLYSTELPLRDLNNPEFLVLALEAAHLCNWQITYISDIGFIARTGQDTEVHLAIEHRFAQLKITSPNYHRGGRAAGRQELERFMHQYDQLKPQFNEEEIAQQYQYLSPYINYSPNDVLKRELWQEKQKAANLLSIFTPVKNYFITPIIINLNILLFFAMVATGVSVLEPDSQSLLSWGANYGPKVMNGEWWRLFSACFLHIGVVHLLLNMYALMYIGFLLEPHLGKMRFSLAYLFTGFVASITSIWWHGATVSAGASGAIFGMYGVFLALLTTRLIDETERKPLLVSIAIFVAYNLIGGLKSGVDNAAHIGGLISGLLIGYAFVPGLKRL